MKEIDFMSVLHKQTKRDYLSRVNDSEYPKDKAAEIAKKFGEEYWDGDRRICYGGYSYIPGRWEKVANAINDHYSIKHQGKVLDIGCGKGYFLFDLKKIRPDIEVFGIDISEYAIKNSKEEIRDRLVTGSATKLPWEDNTFDLIVSMTTLHNLYNYELDAALKEINRVGKKNKYICVESYRTETEKMNLLYWQLTCEAFNRPEEWIHIFNQNRYDGDYSFIFFE